MYHHYSLHKIDDDAKLSFSPSDYSKFKFGDPMSTDSFGKHLASGFLQQSGNLLLQHNDIVFLPSPFNCIPTASYFLSQKFKTEVNKFLHKHDKKALLESKIHRYKTYSEDYGNLNSEERLNLISTDTYHVDTKFLTNRLCIFLDDIKITGSHELIIRKILRQNNIEGDFMFVYFAELTNKNISPVFENFLNYHFVKGIDEIKVLLNNPGLQINTRTIKFILNEKNPINSLILDVPKNVFQKIIDYAIGNNYHLMDEYKVNLNKLIKHTEYDKISIALSHAEARSICSLDYCAPGQTLPSPA